jgi:heptosyltransferase-2
VSAQFEFPSSDIRRILVRSVNWVGDAVLTLPALMALRRRFPSAEVAVLASPWVAGLFAGQPSVDRVIELWRDGGHGGLRGRWRLARRLRAEGFDLAVLLPNSVDAALVPWLAGIPRRLGVPADGRGLLLTHRVSAPAPAGSHQVERYLGLVRSLGADGAPVPRLRVSEAARGAAARLLEEQGAMAGRRLVALNPGSVYGGAKRWPAERYAAVGDALAAQGCTILLVGSRREAPILQAVAAGMHKPAIVLAGRTDLPTLAALLERCRLLLTNDTGAMHVAGAVGTPVLALFGPTDAQATGPLGPTARVIREPVPCSPCLYRECPIDHRCMTRIAVDQALEAAVTLVGEQSGGGVEERRGAEAQRRQGEEGSVTRHPAPGTRHSAPRRAAFLDRDGTIIEDLGYLSDPAQIRVIPGAVEALRALQAAGYRLVLITNQAGVARGLMTEEDVRRVNDALMSRLGEAGIRFDGVYYCPHHPEHGPPEYRLQCACRKPGPGMIRRAAEDANLDPARSVIIGDHSTDAAVARGFPGMRGVLLLTGHGAGQAEKVERGEVARPDHVAADLAAAVQWVLANGKEPHGGPAHPA